MSIFICWILFPTLFCLLCLGGGLLVRWASGAALRGVLLLPVGYATIVVASQVTTFYKATTVLATPLVIALAVVGLAIGARHLRPATCDLWPGAAGFATFCVYAAPVVLSGAATFLGYTLLGDTSIHFTLIDWVMKHGFHTVPAGPPSSTHAAIAAYLGTAYPLGAQTALGAVRPLVGQDVAWVFQPYITLLAVFTSLSIYAILERSIAPRWLLALAAFLAAQPGLVYAYALEASVKEMATICMIAMIVAVGADYVARRGGLRAVVPLAMTSAAGIAVLNASILPWLGPILVAVLVGLLAARGLDTWRRAAAEAGVFMVVAAALSYPSLAVVRKFIGDTTATLTSGTDFGNLLGRLSIWQAFGIWPTGDFRFELVNHVAIVQVLIGLVAISAVVGLVWALRQRLVVPVVFVGASVIGWAYITARSNAWGDAKALMIVSPAVIAAAMLAPAYLWRTRRLPQAVLVAGAIAFGVLWTNALAYHYADLAPRDRLSELARIGDRFAGQGPTLYPEFEEFAKHFLRKEDPTGSSETWQDGPRGKLANGAGTGFGLSSDVDLFDPKYVQRFRTLVLRRSGSAGRPPSNYRLVYSGRFYDVWQKTLAPAPLAHVPLGSDLQPGGVLPCKQLKSLTTTGANRLAYVERPQLPTFFPLKAQIPRYWLIDLTDHQSLRPLGAGTVTGTIDVTQTATYTVWVQGSFVRPIDVVIDGRRVGAVKHQLNPRGSFDRAGRITLPLGRHTIQLVRGTGSLYPGDGSRDQRVGPVVLDPSTDTRTVKQVPVSRWRDLCGRSLDWVEAIR